MKPLDELPKISFNENSFQRQRENEIIDFIDYGCKYAELKHFSRVSVQREIELYKKAIRKLQFINREDKEMVAVLKSLKVCQRQKKPHIIRGTESDNDKA